MADAPTRYTLDFVRRSLPPGAERLLEVGCGDGALAALLKRDGYRAVALDSDEACVAAAESAGVDARLAQWPEFDDGRFDAVLFTRSLHHVDDLDRGVEAAFAALEPGGRVVVEDFDFAFGDETAFRWFAARLQDLAAEGLDLAPADFLSALAAGHSDPLAVWHDQHHHDLHSASAIEAALREHAGSVGAEPAAYFFRYVARLPGASETLVGSLLGLELGAIASGEIVPLGRRFVADA